MAFIITTTGIQNPVIFNDLGGRSYPHPTISYDLESEYTNEEIRNSLDVQSAIDNNYITAVDENGDQILSLLNEDEYSITREIIAWSLIH